METGLLPSAFYHGGQLFTKLLKLKMPEPSTPSQGFESLYYSFASVSGQFTAKNFPPTLLQPQCPAVQIEPGSRSPYIHRLPGIQSKHRGLLFLLTLPSPASCRSPFPRSACCRCAEASKLSWHPYPRSSGKKIHWCGPQAQKDFQQQNLPEVSYNRQGG